MLSGDRAALYDKRSMSGVAVDDDVLRAWEAAKDARDASWVCGGYDPAVKDRICLKAIGTNGYLELMEAFAEFDSDVLYGACVFYTGGHRKFFFFTHVGAGVAGMKKARVAMHKSGVYNAFAGVVAELYATDKDEAAPASVLSKLVKDTGASDVSFLPPS